jgi:putative ABC transport system permease protein
MKGLGFLKVRDSLITGVNEIWYHKLRSFLTLVGIMLGVASLICMMGIMNGFRQTFIDFSNAQNGNSRIGIGNLNDWERGELAKTFKIKGMTIDDMRVIIDNHKDDIKVIIPQITMGNTVIQRGNKSIRAWNWTAIGTTADYAVVDNQQMDRGRNLTPLDDVSLSRVCVIGPIIRFELFDDFENPIGQKIDVNGVKFTIVGMFKYQSAKDPNVIGGESQEAEKKKKELEDKANKTGIKLPTRAIAVKQSEDVKEVHGHELWDKYGEGNPIWHKNLKVIIPFSTFQSLYKQDKLVDSFDIIFKDSENMTAKIEAVKATLKKAHGGAEDFRINPWNEWFQEGAQQIKILRIVFLIITSIALVVGCVGIMNVVLASISERIREIGVRKSVGARNVDIFVQFLIEAVILAMMGGCIGIPVGYGLAHFIGFLFKLRIVIPTMYSVVITVGISSAVGLLAGIYPSFKASRLNPIDALRYE